MKLASWLNIIGLLGGVWIVVAPYVVGYGPAHGNPWSGAILGIDIMAALVILASLAGLAGFWNGMLKELGQRVGPFIHE